MSKTEKVNKINKTNAMRALDTQHIAYTHTAYPCDGFMDGLSVAKAVGKAPEECFKTLVTTAASRLHYVFVIPVGEELDLKKAAASVGEKSIAMLPAKEITATTGYVKGGCSPIGMKKPFTTVIDESAESLREITVSAGKLGLQITLAPQDLAQICNARFARLTV